MNEEEIKVAETEYSRAISEDEIKEKFNSYRESIKSGVDPYINYRNQQLNAEYLQNNNPFMNDVFGSKPKTPIESYRTVFMDTSDAPDTYNGSFNIQFKDNPAFNIKNEEIETIPEPRIKVPEPVVGSMAWYTEKFGKTIAEKVVKKAYSKELLQSIGNSNSDQYGQAKPVNISKIMVNNNTVNYKYGSYTNLPEAVPEENIQVGAFDFDDLPDLDWDNAEKLENEVEEQPKVMKKDYQYRVILSHNKMKINYIQCPVDYKGSDADLLATATVGSNRDIRLIGYIPKFDKSGKEIIPPKKKGKYMPPKYPGLVNRNTIPISEFIEKTNSIFTREITFDEFFRAKSISRMNKRQLNQRIVDENCPINMLVYDNISSQYGITTGNIRNNTFLEVITIANMHGANGYIDKSQFRLEEFNSAVIDIVADDRILMRFFRAKPGSSLKSRTLYGGTIAERKRLDGKILGDDRILIRENYVIDINKPGNLVLQIVNDNRDAYIYTLAEESKLLTINPDQLQKLRGKTIKKVEKNKQAIIRDDRRLKGLKKGDVVLVEAILTKPSKSLSLVTIMANGKRQTIFLKQLKPYAEIDKKTVKKESKPSGIIDVSKTSGSLYNESSKETTSEIKPKAVVKKRAAKTTVISEGISSYIFSNKDHSNIVELPF